MSKAAQGMTIRDEIEEIDPSLMEDIPFGGFLEEITDMFGAEIEQGQTF